MVDKQAKTSLSLEPTLFKIPFSNFKPSINIYLGRMANFIDMLLLPFCLLLLPLWESVIVLCFVVRYFLFILVLQSS